jgi:peptidoglycan/xylan/chitin deacetylase (PgdA/CDA1 family)
MINFKTTTLLFFFFLLVFNLVNVFLCPAETGLCGFFCHHQPAFYLILLGGYLTTGAVFAFFPCSRFHHRDVVCKGSPAMDTVALTFDDGPDPVNTPLVLDMLSRNKVKATFFLIGKKLEGNETLVKRIIDEGHVIGNHSYSHSHTWDFQLAFMMRKDIRKTEAQLFKLTGYRTRLFRPPYGVINPMVSNALKKLHGYRVIAWNRRSFDTISGHEEIVLSRILKGISAGDIILLHDTVPLTVRILEQVIGSIKEKGFTFVSIAEMLKINAYE